MIDQSNETNSQTPQTGREILHQTALKAPQKSGVYLWRDKTKTVIYVGKAKNLKNRLTSYFSQNKDIKTKLLVEHASSIEYITTNNEYEAFLLENNLIKKYSPKYNICLKDGKSYPVLKITNDAYPVIYKTRNVIKDGSFYYGPYPDATALETFIETLYQIYPIRHCKRFTQKKSPCMYYHIGRCLAPCCKKIENSTYNEFIEEIKALLEPQNTETVQKLEKMMKNAAKDLNFEKAARLRDGIKALEILHKQNIVESFDDEDKDYIASYREGELVSFTILKIRNGKLNCRDNYRTITLKDDTELNEEFMSAYYTDESLIPPSIYVESLEGSQNIKRWLTENYNKKIRIVGLSRRLEKYAMHKAAIEMAKENAKEDIIRRQRERGDYPAMYELQKLLKLPNLPVRIEGFDIAHIGGKFPVASLISFYNGNPDKKNYRYFRLKTTNGIIDDFASMREAVSRRYTRLLNEKKELPDLLLIDGGIGQVNAVNGIIESLGLSIPIAGLAKRDEEIYRPGNSTPVCLPKSSDGLRLLQRVRDETHRFATSRNQNLRTKENTVSPFLKLPHVSEKREKVLMIHYGTLEKLCEAETSSLQELLHISQKQAEEILDSAGIEYQNQTKTKKKQLLSLELAGTTKEIAAHHKEISNLALAALDSPYEDMMNEEALETKVASPDSAPDSDTDTDEN